MSKHSKGKVDYCLNRLIIEEDKNPDKINPFIIIRKFCDFDSHPAMKILFLKFCKAALVEKYFWEEGPPGKLLYFSEQLELLMEACYLIYIEKEFNKRLVKGDKSSIIPNPFIVIKDFFDLRSLLEWKKSQHFWLEAGLSNFSVMDNVEPEEVLIYYSSVEELLAASYQITFPC